MKLYLLGGFLGSGKTTAIYSGCQALLKDNMSVAVITNDQGMQLVDSAFIKGHQIAAKEVVKGCFCCNYNQLEAGILALQEEQAPDVVFAESVGSCADIVATVIRPLLKFHPDLKIVYSVFVDALLLNKMAEGKTVFNDEDVNYIFEKQLEEADLLIVNKADLLSPEKHNLITEMINGRFEGKAVLFQNSLQQKDIGQWLETLHTYEGAPARKSLEIDYNKYGAGEAKLAWLDDEVEITAFQFNAVEAATALINKIYRDIRLQSLPVGHLKFLMRAGEWQRKISFTSLDEPLLKQTASPMRLESVSLLINARVQASPAQLKQIVTGAFDHIMEEYGCRIESDNLTAFQPGFPTPAYRMENEDQ